MEALRGHTPHTPKRLTQYPTATYSVHTGRISFAPGTKYNRKLESRVSDRARTTTMNIRPLQDGEKPPSARFRTPKSTIPFLTSQSLTGMDYIDPRYAPEYTRWSEIPSYFCRSKSDALVSDKFADEIQIRTREAVTDSTLIPMPGDQVDSFSDDGLELSSVHASRNSNISPERYRATSQISRTADKSRDDIRSKTSEYPCKTGSGGRFRPVIPHYKPLIGEVYNIRRLDPAHNPWRSLQLESEVNQYIEHKKKCQGRNVRFRDIIDVTSHEPHVVTDGGHIQRHNVKRRSLDERARQRKFSYDFQKNGSIAEVARQQGRMYNMQAQLKNMLQER